MTEYLITFNDEWVPDHTADELREKGKAARCAGTGVSTRRFPTRGRSRPRVGGDPDGAGRAPGHGCPSRGGPAATPGSGGTEAGTAAPGRARLGTGR